MIPRLALPLVLAAAPSAIADDVWLDAWGNGVPGTTVFAVDGSAGRPYAIVLSGALQEQSVLGLEIHVDLSWLWATTAIPGFVGVLDAAGNATVSVPVPNLPALVGIPFFSQAFLLNPLDSESNWSSVVYQVAPGTGPGSGLPAFQHRQGGIAHGVHFLDGNNGWTAEDGGRIRVTHDGGASWKFQRTPEGARSQLRGIFFLDEDLGWAVGDGGLVIRTTNGGSLWTRVASAPTTADLYQVRFVSPTQGWIVGNDGTLLASTDGGATWVSQAPPCLGTGDLYGLAFTSPTTGFAVGDQAILLATTDAGLTWVSTPNPYNPSGLCPQPGVGTEWWSIDFETPTVGWIAGGAWTQTGAVIVTTDGGQTWSPTSFCTPTSPATLYGIAAFGGGEALAVGYGSGTFLADSPTACFTDQTVAAFVHPPLFAASAPTPLDVWSVGMFDAIRHSGDGGLTWENQAGDETFRLNDGCFLDATTGWIAGQGTGIAKTVDGGATFQTQFSQPTGNFALGIDFANALVGCAVGQAGFVRTTADGGQTWVAPASVPTGVDLADVAFVTPSIVVAVGRAGVVLASVNAGAAWSAITLPGAPDLEAVAFADPLNGVVVGAGGAAFRYAAGLWSPVPTGTAADLHSVSLPSPTGGFAVGDGGIVLAYDGVAFAPAYASSTGLALHAVEALPGGEVFAAGDAGLFVRFDGTAWSEPKSRTSIPLRALSFDSATSGWGVGVTYLVTRFAPE